jgi:hypothetical protein
MPKYYVLDGAGVWQRINFPGKLEGEIVDIDPALFDALGNSVPAFIENAVTNKDGKPVKLCRAEGYTYASVTLPTLKLLTNFSSVKNIIRPDWGNGESPQFAIDWAVPADMILRFAIQGREHNCPCYIENVYLIAFDKVNPTKTYKLPLPNVYTHGHICLPTDFTKQHNTVIGALDYALTQIEQSPWNDHLIRQNAEVEKSKKLFGFKADADTFETLTPDDDWRKICNTVGNASLEYIAP